MSRKKYVMLDECFPVLFTEAIGHNAFEMVHDGITYVKATSAGFFNIGDDNTVATFGESTSLKLQSKPEDARLIQKLLFGD